MRALKLGLLFVLGGVIWLADPRAAHAVNAETCGNAVDDDGNGLADNGCFPDGLVNLCESPLPCSSNGHVAPEFGQLVFPVRPDHAPRVPYGPPLEFRRVFTPAFDPPGNWFPGAGGECNFSHPIGYGVQHNWMAWTKKIPGTACTSGTKHQAVVHLRTGEDVLFTCDSTAGNYEVYKPQAGRHYIHLRQHTTNGTWELKYLDGWEDDFDQTDPSDSNIRKLTSVKDSLGNTVSITYFTSGSDNGQIDRVTAAGGEKYFAFTYGTSGKRLLAKVRLNTTAGTGTTYDVDFAYNATYAGNLNTVTRGGDIVETITVDSSNRVTKIESDSKTVVEFRWLSTSAVATSESKDGALGYKYDACGTGTLGTYVYFNRLDGTTTCDIDGDCGTGYCGGQTGAGGAGDNTGYCFAARRCVEFVNTKETLVTAVSGSCNSCIGMKEYSWDSTTLDLLGTKTADDTITSHHYDSNGMRDVTVEADNNYVTTDSDPAGARRTWFYYSNSSFPGLLTETRRKSELSDATNCNSSQCSSTSTTGCKRSVRTWTTGGQLDTSQNIGCTYAVSGGTYGVTGYTYTSDWTYDTVGRVTKFEGPRSVLDNIEYTYYTTSGPQKDYLNEVKRQIGTTTYLITTFAEYDGTGFAGRESDPNSTTKCRTWNSKHHRLATERQVVDGTWNDCSAAPGSNDEKVTWNYDKHGRLIEMQKPRWNCITREYDSLGRLSILTQRDATCVTAGNSISYSYNSDGEVTKIEWKTDGGTVKRTQEYTYYADTRRKTLVNPVDSNKSKELSYDNDGVLAEVKDEIIGSVTDTTQYDVDPLNRLDVVRRGTTSSTKTWNLTSGVQLDLPTRVADPLSKNIDVVWDDLNRKVKEVSPNQGGAAYFVYDEAGNLVEKTEADGNSDEMKTTYTYDWQNRLTAVNLGDAACFTQGGAEIQYVYDSNSAENCPTGSSCNRLSGRLAYVKTKMWCDDAKSDDTFDQRTWYSYTHAGRTEEHTIMRDDSSTNTYRVTYTYDKNGNPTRINPPSGSTGGAVYTYDGGTDASNADLVTSMSRDTTQLISSIKYLPFGPWTEYTQANGYYHPAGGTFYPIKVTATLNQAYRYTQIKAASTYSTPDNVTQMDLAEDAKGRYTKRDFSYANSEKDMWFMYDSFDHLCCRTKNSQSCHTGSPPWTCACSNCPSSGDTQLEHAEYNDAGDRTKMIHEGDNFPLQTYNTDYVSGTSLIECIRKDSATTCQSNYRIAFVWDGRGNRVEDDDNEFSDDYRDYTYDGKNRLSTLTHDGHSGTGVGDHVMTFSYDHLDRLIFIGDCDIVTDPTCSTPETTYLYYDQWGHVIETVNGTKTRQHYYLAGRPIFSRSQGGNLWRVFNHGEEQGRPYKRTDWPSSGDASIDWSKAISAWDWAGGGSLVDQPYISFPGQLCVGETKATTGSFVTKRPRLCFDRNGRVYDPFTGTYLQELQDKGGAFSGPTRAAAANRAYAYAQSNPVTRARGSWVSARGSADPRSAGDFTTIPFDDPDFEKCGGDGVDREKEGTVEEPDRWCTTSCYACGEKTDGSVITCCHTSCVDKPRTNGPQGGFGCCACVW